MNSTGPATPQSPLPGFAYRVEINVPEIMAQFLRFVAEQIEKGNIKPVVTVVRDEDRGLHIVTKEPAPHGDGRYVVFDWLRTHAGN